MKPWKYTRGKLAIDELPSIEAYAADVTKKKGDYGSVEYADHGMQPDGKPRYPIDTPEHIRAAWSYSHQKKDMDKYTASQLATIHSRIVAAWKKHISKDGPPSA